MRSAILVTARLKSTRLPRKVALPIFGRPLIGHMIERLRLAREPERIVLCTSTVDQDSPLVEIARSEGVECFRGHPDDVLQRLTEAAELFSLDTALVCTADNPFVDPIYIDRLLQYHHAAGNDYSISVGLPLGTFAYALSVPAMRRACEMKAETDTEWWGGYFTDTGVFRTGQLHADEEFHWPELRLTVDTPQDFELITKIFETLGSDGKVFPLSEVISLLRSRPDLRAINASVRQKPAKPIRLRTEYIPEEVSQ